MKRTAVFLAVAVGIVGVAVSLKAADNAYRNEAFRFRCTYPEGWKMKEQTPNASVNIGESAIGVRLGKDVDVGKRMGMPEMTNVCFAAKSCKPGEEGRGTEIHITMMEARDPKRAKAPQAAPEKKGKERREASESKAKSECDLIARGRRMWAGVNTPYETMRCPEKKRWRYTTTMFTNRRAKGASNTYMLRCSMLSKTRDKADSLLEYNRELKPACDANIASAKITR